MIMHSFQASLLLISEDSGRCSPIVAEGLAKKVVRVVDSRVQTHRILFAPLDHDHPGALAAHANRWRSRDAKCRNSRRELVATIATQLAVPNGFVFFHVDGDTRWKQRDDSPNRDDFEKCVRGEVERFLTAHLESSTAVQLCLGKLFLMMPFYSIEAWLYQNTDRAIDLCRANCGKHVEDFNDWARDRALLDELTKPKDAVCLADKHNDTLAQAAFPAEKVYEARKSFAQLIDELKASSSFAIALAATYT